MDTRTATIERNTNETQIKLTLDLDGGGNCRCATGIGFFDHMLEIFARHGLFDLELDCSGDLAVDTHHLVEDVGIVLGTAVRSALGEKQGIRRYGSCLLPMDEALILCAVDLSGRPHFVSDVTYSTEKIGALDTNMLFEFFYALSYVAGMNLHLKKLDGHNDHHVAECCFKAFAKALDMAVSIDPRVTGVWSTKGKL